MSRMILLIFLIINSVLIGGCALVTPFKPINSCSDAKNKGANCASVESNLEYSLNMDNTKGQPVVIPEESKKDKKKNIKDAEAEPIPVEPLKPEHSDSQVEKDELVRLVTELNIEPSMTKRPVMVPPASYRVLVLPYSDGAKFYSGRYIYVTAGKAKWIAGNYVVSGEKYKIDVPVVKETPKKEIVIETKPQVVDITKKPALKAKPVKHKVNAYLLNCRDIPSMEGNAVAVFEQDRVLDIVDKSLWWKVNYYDMTCYVNPKYLYSEPEQ